MGKEAENSGARRSSPWRIAAWGTAALLLLLPLVAMRFTDEVNWNGEDFIFAAVLIGGTGLTFELAVRKSGSLAFRAAVGVALAAAFLTLWANGAVGMVGSEGNRYNLVFYGVLIVALIGAAVARFKPAGMARAMAVAAIAQAAAGAGGLSTDPLGGVLSMAFAAPWLLAAALFRKAARERTAGREAPQA